MEKINTIAWKYMSVSREQLSYLLFNFCKADLGLRQTKSSVWITFIKRYRILDLTPIFKDAALDCYRLRHQIQKTFFFPFCYPCLTNGSCKYCIRSIRPLLTSGYRIANIFFSFNHIKSLKKEREILAKPCNTQQANIYS